MTIVHAINVEKMSVVQTIVIAQYLMYLCFNTASSSATNRKEHGRGKPNNMKTLSVHVGKLFGLHIAQVIYLLYLFQHRLKSWCYKQK